MRRFVVLLVVVAAGALAPGAGAASLVAVELDRPQMDLAVLERLGLDVTHDVTPRRATVLATGPEQLRLLRRTGFAFRRVRVGR